MIFKKILLIPLLTLFTFNAFSQATLKGKIFDSETGEPLPFVNVVFNEKGNGFTTSLDGDFKITTTDSIHWLKISYLGYIPQKIEVTLDNINKPFGIGLVKTSYKINEVVIKPGVNPAHRIIIAAYNNRAKNNPERLASFRYTSYNKLYFTIDKLTAKRIRRVDSDSLKKIDSTLIKLEKLKKNQYLMMFETVSKREFQAPSNNQEDIIASRVSGLKDPFIAFLATQFQSFSFYPELITLADKAYLNPISAGSTRKYLFIIEDTLLTPENDTLFVISFRPHKNRNFEGLMGRLTINSRGYAIQNVIAEPSSPETGTISIKIQQRYERFKDDAWFPVELNTDLIVNPINDLKNRKTGNTYKVQMIGVGKSYLKDIEINPEIKSHNFSHIEATFDPQAGSRNIEFWQLYRKDSLTEKELRTYRIIDSLGRKHNFDRRMRIIESLMTGRIPMGYLNLNINQLFGYNMFEGYRLGLGLETNSKVSKYFKVGGYTAYGFKDMTYKYGGFSDITLNRKYEFAIGYSYKNDVRESGSYHFGGEVSLFSGSDFYRTISIVKMDGIEEHQANIRFRFLKAFKLNISMANQKYNLLSHYYYKAPNPADTIKTFDQSEFSAILRFAPGEKFMETPRGIVPLNIDFPILFVKYTKGLKTFNGKFNYDKLEVRLDKSYQWRILGKTSIGVDAGKVFGNIPLSLMYFGRANYFDGGISIDASHCFGAMRMNEFVSDRYVNIFIKHDFAKLFWRNRKGRWQPEVAIAHNISYGNVSTNTLHIVPNGFTINAPTKGYYETGLMINKLIPSGFVAYGFGVFYRYGAYHFADEKENFAYKITLSYIF
jgi:hypothetical protein